MRIIPYNLHIHLHTCTTDEYTDNIKVDTKKWEDELVYRGHILNTRSDRI